MRFLSYTSLFVFALYSCGGSKTTEKTTPKNTVTPGATEKHFKSLTQLTFGGDNAEAYWSFDSKSITFQSNNPAWGLECDQIFSAPIASFVDSTFKPQIISTGAGRTTCSYFMPGNNSVLFASTHVSNKACPVVPDHSHGYVWPVYDAYDIFVSDLKGKIENQLTQEKGYDAEATVSPDGKSIVFTSTRSGDLELWIMDIDGKNPRQITHGLGYDGGAFFSPDSKKLVFRSSRPTAPEDVKHYKDLLAKGLVEPSDMEIYTVNVDGTDLKQITHLGKANWAPFYHPSGKKILFSSNHKSTKGYDFQLYMINEDGSGLEQVTTESVFNSFPMFSPDGKYLIFSSNRNNHGTRATNLFVAEWQD
ncbi:MAG: PD40 domain-containing protein [Bacteroidia bacterium]|nr:PD40 domain-containing protein [Bacteroidia bacterium]